MHGESLDGKAPLEQGQAVLLLLPGKLQRLPFLRMLSLCKRKMT
jgi:hypothetical protein